MTLKKIIDGSDGKESACNAGDPGSIPGWERSPGEGNGNPLQYFAWKIPWTEEPDGLRFMGSQSCTRFHFYTFASRIGNPSSF